MGSMKPLWEQCAEDWQRVLGVNVLGITNAIRAFVPHMLAQDEPAHIVNTASEAAFAARAFVGVYHASKHAALAITETLAQELAFFGADIRVSVVCPGAINTSLMDAVPNRPAELSRNPPAQEPQEFGDRLAAVYKKFKG